MTDLRTLGGGLNKSDADADYAPKWLPNHAYTAGDVVMAPDGSIVKRLTSGTSGSSYTSTNWQTVATVAGTQAAAELNNAFARLSGVQATRTTSGALVAGSHNPVDATSGNLTVTLADAASAGLLVSVSKKDSTANTVTVSVAHLRDGGAGTIVLVGQYEALTLTSKADGTWWPIGDHKTKAYFDTTYEARTVATSLSTAASGTANRAALLAAVNAAMASDRTLVLPAGTFDIGDDEILVDQPLRVVGQGPGLTTLHKTTKARAIFKVTAPNCEFREFNATGLGLDVTGFGLNGSDSFRRHVAIWATLTAHDLIVDNVTADSLMMAVYMRDYFPGETATYSSTGLKRPKITNVTATNVLFGVHGGPVIDPHIDNVTGTYALATGTPTNGDTASPPHMVYLDGDTTHRNKGGKITGTAGSNTYANVGAPLKLKYYDGPVIHGVNARDTSGTVEAQDITDAELDGIVSLNDHYPVSDGRGAIWLVDCARVKIIEPVIRFVNSAHGLGFWENSGTTDTELVRPKFAMNLSADNANVNGITIQGTRGVVVSPVIESLSGQINAGVFLSGTNGRVIDPTSTGKATYGVYCRQGRQIVEYDPAVLLASRTASNAVALGIHADATAAGTLTRDRSIGQAFPVAFVDEFNRGGVVVNGLATTDDAKPWLYADSAGGLNGTGTTWQITASNQAKYTGAGARSIAVANGGKSDGSVKATIGVNASSADVGVAGRVTDFNNYVAATFNFSGTDHKIDLITRVAGTRTHVAQSTVTVNAGDEVELVLSGTTASVKVNGTQVIAAQSISTVPVTNYHGILGAVTETTLTFERAQFI